MNETLLEVLNIIADAFRELWERIKNNLRKLKDEDTFRIK